MTDKELKNIVLDRDKFLSMAKRFGFEVDIVGESVSLIKSSFDNWQTEIEYRHNKSAYEIRLNHMNTNTETTKGNRGLYHLQGYHTSYYGVFKYIEKHDRYVKNNPDRKMSSGLREMSRIDELLNMINGKEPQSQHQ